MALPSIFISYRRDDSRADAGRLYDRLSARFGSDHVFMDVDDIDPGERFPEVLRRTLEACQVLIVVIGPHWLTAADEDGVPRLRSPGDVLRLELRTALQRGITIVPVLTNRAPMPVADELPADIASLADFQAIEISDVDFHEDVDELVIALGPLLSAARSITARRIRRGVVFATLAVAIALAWHYLVPLVPAGGGLIELRGVPAQLSSAGVRQMLVDRDLFDARWHPAGKGLEHQYELKLVGELAVVLDRSTGLMWQQSSGNRQTTWGDALVRIAALNQSHFAGASNWRLPTIEEAAALLVPRREGGYYLSALLAPEDSPVFWSADSAGAEARWVLYARDGIARPESVNFNAWVRAVSTLE